MSEDERLPEPDAAAVDAAADGAGPEPAREGPEDDAEPGAAALPIEHRAEALVFASPQPLPTVRLAKLLGVPFEEAKAVVEDLAARWEDRPGAIQLVEIAGGWRFMTRPAFHDDLQGLAARKGTARLSPAALETLAVVAYRQPITREEIEGVRGVQSGPLLRALLERDLIRITGRSDKPGHPLLYGTTKRFLDHFGLKNIRSLPDLKDLLDS